MKSVDNKTAVFGNPDSVHVFIQPVDDHDLEELQNEMETLKKESGSDDWCILTVKVNDWNRELTPWKAEPVWGKAGFGDGAPETLKHIMEKIIPELDRLHPCKARRYFIGGYSLAGLFALWAAYQTDRFVGAAAVSPSVWYPGWIDYAKRHRPLAPSIYLSLGDREEKTRNKVMATVGDAIREQEQILENGGVKTVLEWNRGNHFADNGMRMGKGFAWLLKEQITCSED